MYELSIVLLYFLLSLEIKFALHFVYTKPVKFKTEVSLWKRRIKYFSSTIRHINLKTNNQPIMLKPFSWAFRCVFEENFDMEIRRLTCRYQFRKAQISKCFSSTRKRKADVFKFFRFEGCFRKASFSWRISIDGKPNRRIETVFSNFSGVMWTEP